jgi:hypothetical protein
MSERLRFYAFRCNSCKRVITKRQILAKWQKYDKSRIPISGLCKCGGIHIRPTNLTIWEEITNPHVWAMFFTEILPKKLGWR